MTYDIRQPSERRIEGMINIIELKQLNTWLYVVYITETRKQALWVGGIQSQSFYMDLGCGEFPCYLLPP